MKKRIDLSGKPSSRKFPIEEYNLADYDVRKRKRLVLHFAHDVYCPEKYKIDFNKMKEIVGKVQSDKINKIYENLFPELQGFNVGLSFSCDEEKIVAIEPKKATILLPSIKRQGEIEGLRIKLATPERKRNHD